MSRLAHVPVRWSWLSQFGQSAAHALESALHGKEPTVSMKLGTAGHVVTFEQPFEVFRAVNPKTGAVWTRSAKAWDEAEADCAARGVTLLTVAEYDKACRIRDALRGHSDAASLLFGPGVVVEQRIAWDRDGRACASTPDARKPDAWIVDLKVVRSAAPRKFCIAAWRAGYPGQLMFYREADRHDLGLHPDSLGVDLFNVAVESSPPYAVQVYELPTATRDYGANLIGRYWEALRVAEECDEWPAYSLGRVMLEIDEDSDGPTNYDLTDLPDAEAPEVGDADGMGTF